MKKIILHLCADIGSDSKPYQDDQNYEVVLIGKEIGVENYNPPAGVHGIIANPVCTDLSTARGFHKENNIERGMFLVRHCLRIIEEAKPVWWKMENPANGRLKDVIGCPKFIYQPWQFGSPYTKKTALWGEFTAPKPKYQKWDDVPKNENLYTRPGRGKPSLAFLHKSAIDHLPEFRWAKDKIKTDADFRSLCSQGFAAAFKEVNP
jgi:hypothetical protein